MGKIIFLGHTGSVNRGCEAIVRSTSEIFKRNGVTDITVFTDNLTDDRSVGLDSVCTELPITNIKFKYIKKGIAKILFRSFGIYMPKEYIHYGNRIKQIKKGDVVFIIGGDTYCYSRPVDYYAANRIAKKRGAKTVLWGCSLEEHLLTKEMIKDLNRYDYICPREEITQKTLENCGISKDKIIKISDPAFNLTPKKAYLPDIMQSGKTVGINISPIVKKNPEAYNSVLALIEYIIKNTSYNIVLIPHVYHKGTVDLSVLTDIYEKFENTNRVGIVNEELSCSELKDIISNCSLFIGARTHSTIAAYSSAIPTLVLGYSVKSRGIATDLFGTTENFVLMIDDLEKSEKLISAFSYINENRDTIANNLKSTIPDYSKLSDTAVKWFIEKEGINKNRKVCSEKRNCSGCSACKAICPKSCIEMKSDSCGFLYPEVNDKECVNCNACENVCYYKNTVYRKSVSGAFAAINNDKTVRASSSSGGVFNALARKTIEDGGVVFGVALDENCFAKHICVDTVDGINELMGSKYVQSDIGNSFSVVKEYLDMGRKVLFTGTPCQVSGLISYLKKDYENLITMDFICHGVPSPLMWEKYISEMSDRFNSRVKKAYFRDKIYGWKNFSMKLQFENGREYISKITEDPYLRSFICDIDLRESCNNCKAKGIDNSADITVADFWGIAKVIPQISDDKGASVVIIRGEKAQAYLNFARRDLTLYPVDIEQVVKNNPSIKKSVALNPLRNKFINTVKKHSFIKAYKRYCSTGFIAKIHRKLGR